MFSLVRLALVTCAFYIGIALLIQAVLFGITAWKGGVFYTVNLWGWGLVFGIVWLISFVLAWRLMVVPLFK
jgi:hypothetical protein